MEKAPFLTIGIASYNYGKYLTKAFEQIKKQNFNDFELLYCDDGSTDDSIDIIETIIRENPEMNIRLIKGENEGLLANRNRIIEYAKGKYLLICDADDYMADNCLEKLCMAAQEKNADCVIGGFCEGNETGKVYKVHVPKKDANKWIYIWHHAQIYKMELVRVHGIKFLHIPDDVCFIQRIHQYAKKTIFVSENLYCWVRHADSASQDIVGNAEWHPRRLWNNIVDCMLEIQKEMTNETDVLRIRYFLYKWFYLNVTDQPIGNKKEAHANLKALQEDMKKICPYYRRMSFLKRALSQEDTFFAKTAIFVCWILEGAGCIGLLPLIRRYQKRVRG